MIDEKHEPRRPSASEELSEVLRKSVEAVLAEPVPDDAVRRAVERYLEIDILPVQKRLHRKWLALAVCVAAAAGLVVVFWTRSGGNRRPNALHKETVSVPAANDVSTDELPTLQACRLALRESPEAMVALMEHSASHRFAAITPCFRSGAQEWPNGSDR